MAPDRTAAKKRVATGAAKADPRGSTAATAGAARADAAGTRPAADADPAPQRPPVEEPVWLVRTVLFLFFVGFAVFLAREVRYALDTFP